MLRSLHFAALLDEYPIEKNTKMHENHQPFFALSYTNVTLENVPLELGHYRKNITWSNSKSFPLLSYINLKSENVPLELGHSPTCST